MSKKLDVASIAILNDQGEVDVEGTCEALFSQVKEYADLHRNDQEKITVALESFFTENPRLRANVPALISMTAHKIGFSASSYGPLTKRIHEVLSASPTIKVVKGPNGGCMLRSNEEKAYFAANGKDMPTTKEETDQVAKLEARLAAAKAKAAK